MDASRPIRCSRRRPATSGSSTARIQLEALVEGIRPELERLQQELELDTDGLDLPPIPEVEPDLHGLPSHPEPLFGSTADWTTATRRLVADRSLAGEGAP